jgi:hypothetical protein
VRDEGRPLVVQTRSLFQVSHAQLQARWLGENPGPIGASDCRRIWLSRPRRVLALDRLERTSVQADHVNTGDSTAERGEHGSKASSGMRSI